MKNLSPALQAHLDDGTTTLSWCWRISRADGVALGFTDHDRALRFDGTAFEPESGFAASEIRAGSDLAVDAQDATGVLTSDRITETDILDGRWDNAAVELWRVNRYDPSQRVLLRRGAVGQRFPVDRNNQIQAVDRPVMWGFGSLSRRGQNKALGDVHCGRCCPLLVAHVPVLAKSVENTYTAQIAKIVSRCAGGLSRRRHHAC